MEIFKAEDLTYFYPQAQKFALEKISFSIREGEFILILGPSGSGKSTLVKALAGFLPEFYGGRISGALSYRGRNITGIDKSLLRKEIGMIFQDPEEQIIMNTVEADIAFGLENLQAKTSDIKRAIAEVSAFMGLTQILSKKCSQLSGGEKQRVVIASCLAMAGSVIILDEPTSQLDPIVAEEVFHAIMRLRQDLGFTVILIEQRLERCFHLCDRIMYLEEGRLAYDSKPQLFSRWAIENNKSFIPTITKLFAKKGFINIPLTISEAKKKLDNYFIKNGIDKIKTRLESFNYINNPVIKVDNVSYTYADGTPALKQVNLDVSAGEFLCILGENGAGKSTLLKNIMGIYKPTAGKIKVFDREINKINERERAAILGYLSQNPNDYLFNDTVEDELAYTLLNIGKKDFTIIKRTLDILDLTEYKDNNPRHLSTGERQRVALACVFAAEPKILLIDEPTRGLSPDIKEKLGLFLRRITREENKTIILITQDIEFAAEYAEKIALLFRGEIIAQGTKYEVFKGDIFYSPSLSKLFRQKSENIVTLQDAFLALG